MADMLTCSQNAINLELGIGREWGSRDSNRDPAGPPRTPNEAQKIPKSQKQKKTKK